MKCIEDEIPFEVPEGWAWSRISSICLKVTDGTHHSPENFPTGEYKYVTAKNIKLDGIVLDDITYVSSETHREIFTRCNPEFGDILYIKDGATSGIATVNTLHEEFSLLSSVALLKPAQGIDNWYMCYAMQSPYFYSTTRGDMKGVGITRITLTMLTSRLIPVPPQNEQQQISIKTRNLIELISNIESDKESITKMASNAKSKILDLAIRGKLVPQDPHDEPASVLLERIHAEKELLIKQGKIKRDKKESVIFKGEDNSYYEMIGNKVNNLDNSNLFDLPDNWCWCRVRSIADVKGGKRLPKGCNFSDTSTNHAYIRVTDMKNHTVNTTNLRYISDEVYEQIKSYIISKNDLYITIAGTIGTVGEIPDELDNMNLTENAAKICNIKISKKYLCYILSSQFVQVQFQEKTHQVAMPKLALERILTTIIPIPPYKEQLLIAKKIEDILHRMNAIENSIC